MAAVSVEKLAAVVLWCLALPLVASPSNAPLIGYLSCLSRDLDIVGFSIDTAHTLTHAYRLQTDGGGNNLIPLRDPCPSCPPSYNLLTLQDNQLLIPVTGKLYIFTVINNTPYSQIVITAGCIPISIFKPDSNYFDQDTLYVECRRQSNHNQYFLAKLVKDQNDLQWSYQTLVNYDDLTSNGAFQYYIDEFDQYMVYYAYGRGDLLYFEGPDNGYYRFFGLPSECAKVVRITCAAKHPQLVIECSNSSNSSVQTITSAFLFHPDSGEFDSLFQGIAYSKCPLRFSDDDSIIAIFTGDDLLVGELSSPSRRVTVENISSVYDALLTQMDGNFYAAFTNASGLYTVNVSQALEGGTVIPLHADNSEDICAHTGCPLLEIIDANTTVVHLNRSIATVSIHPPRLLNSSSISNQPVRFIFHKLHPQPTPTVQTATTEVQLKPSVPHTTHTLSLTSTVHSYLPTSTPATTNTPGIEIVESRFKLLQVVAITVSSGSILVIVGCILTVLAGGRKLSTCRRANSYTILGCTPREEESMASMEREHGSSPDIVLQQRNEGPVPSEQSNHSQGDNESTSFEERSHHETEVPAHQSPVQSGPDNSHNASGHMVTGMINATPDVQLGRRD